MTRQNKGKTTVALRDSKDRCIDAFIAAGFAIFDLKGKVPAVKRWQNTLNDPTLDHTDFVGNYGVVLQDDDLVIDVDPRNFADGDDPIGRLWVDAQMEHLKDGMMVVQTGGGGYHFYMKKMPGFPISKTVKNYPGIDFLTKGTFVVGPGSIHPDTKDAYTVLSGSPHYTQGATDLLLGLIQRGESFKSKEIEITDDEGSIQRYTMYLKNCPAAIEGQEGDNTTYKTACMGRDFGLSPEMTYKLLKKFFNPRCQPMWHPNELKKKVKNAFGYGKNAQGTLNPAADFDGIEVPVDADPLVVKELDFYRWKMINGKEPKPNDLGNTVNYFLLNEGENPLYRLIRYNEFSDQIEFNFAAPWHNKDNPPKLWCDTDAVQLKYWLSQVKHYVTTTNICHEAAISLSATLYQYHPVKTYLRRLVWDKTPRLDRFLHTYTGAPHTPYTAAVGKNTLIAGVARIFEPGCQFDHILILEGDQGTGKSTFVRTLGGAWYKDIIIDPHNKDTIDAMKGGWVIEASEMEFVRRADVQALKSFITRVADFARPAYAKTTKEFPRQSIIIGTINPEKGAGYFRDKTGNRRFWPVATTKIDIPKLKEDRDQLWAEAVHRYFEGEKFFLDDAELVLAAEMEQSARESEDPWADIIADWQKFCLDNDELPEVITAAHIARDALNMSPRSIDRNTNLRIGYIMKELGWERGKFYVKQLGKTAAAFKRPVDSLEGL